jgi:hypothetical protein
MRAQCYLSTSPALRLTRRGVPLNVAWAAEQRRGGRFWSGRGRPHRNPCASAVYRAQAAHAEQAEVAQATKYDGMGSVNGSRARLPTARAMCAAHSAQKQRAALAC